MNRIPPFGGALLLIGCGNMGGALLERWQQHDVHIHVVDPHAARKHAHNVSWHTSLHDVPALTPETIVLAVKPQSLDAILPPLRERFAPAAPLYLSIAAGKTIPFYKEHLGRQAHVVRAMPNTPAMVGEGFSSLYAEPTLSETLKQRAEQLMRAVGDTLWLRDESQMHAATALAGSGPAYLFHVLDALAGAAMQAGIAEADARRMALAMTRGSAALAEQGHEPFARLEQAVTSPGGVTEAALRVMREAGLRDTLMRAMQRAIARSQELGS